MNQLCRALHYFYSQPFCFRTTTSIIISIKWQQSDHINFQGTLTNEDLCIENLTSLIVSRHISTLRHLSPYISTTNLSPYISPHTLHLLPLNSDLTPPVPLGVMQWQWCQCRAVSDIAVQSCVWGELCDKSWLQLQRITLSNLSQLRLGWPDNQCSSEFYLRYPDRAQLLSV